MKVLITGAAGFIASHLSERYLADGWRVLGVDNFCTGSRANLAKAKESPRYAFLDADVVGQWKRVESWLEELRVVPDLVLHMASPASPVDYAQLPLQTLAVNSEGTRNSADAAVRWGARYLFASTSEAYGDPKEHPQRESYWGNVNPVGPRSCYDEGKRFGEAMVMAQIRASKLDGRIIRIFNTYGPRMRQNDGRVVPNFIMQALSGMPLTIYGDGSQTRSFCYVDDLVEGIMRCAGSARTQGAVVNLGNPQEHTIREFAEIVSGIVGVPFEVVNRPIPPDDPTRRCPDISLARELLDWEPVVPLHEGISRTVESLRVPA